MSKNQISEAMQLTINRPDIAQTAIVAVAMLAALSLLGVVAAYWTWGWFAPRPQPVVHAPAGPSGPVASALDLFGSVQREATIGAPTGIAIRLLGVVAATQGRDGYAIVVLDGKQILASREGEEISPGILLAQVAADHIVLERGGNRETLAWPDKPTGAASSPQRISR